jgi:hypothetical protein
VVNASKPNVRNYTGYLGANARRISYRYDGTQRDPITDFCGSDSEPSDTINIWDFLNRRIIANFCRQTPHHAIMSSFLIPSEY